MVFLRFNHNVSQFGFILQFLFKTTSTLAPTASTYISWHGNLSLLHSSFFQNTKLNERYIYQCGKDLGEMPYMTLSHTPYFLSSSPHCAYFSGKKVKLRKVKRLFQSHTAGEHYSQHSNSTNLMLLTHHTPASCF